MRGLENMNHHYYTYSFLLIFVTLLVLPEFSISRNTLSSTKSLKISSNLQKRTHVKRMRLSCSEDRFVKLKNRMLPATENVIIEKGISTKECWEKCSRECNCTAFATTDIQNGGWGCVIWTGELTNVPTYDVDGQHLYIRLAASDEDMTKREAEETNKWGKIIGSIIIGGSMIILLILIIFYFWIKKQEPARAISSPSVYEDNNRALTFEEIINKYFRLPKMESEAIVVATNNFSESNKLGRSRYGSVYKGRLSDGQEIAVKRFSKMSSQGTLQFKNEMKLVMNLHHRNVFQLLGWCADADENMLIYEYSKNLTLDFHLFDKTRSSKLNWQMRFYIINGIVNGFIYLHRDSRIKIIHRDLKPSNILLGKDMTPKISDFEMAKIVELDKSRACISGLEKTKDYTAELVGTYGYMSPECAMFGICSIKSDVFSFGVLLLEIICGKKITRFSISDCDINLGYVWRKWKEGNWQEVVDPIIIDSISPTTFELKEVIRCIQIGLLCVQDHAQDRPTMWSVGWMLGSKTLPIPQPKPSPYWFISSPLESDSLSEDGESWTVSQISLVVNGR